MIRRLWSFLEGEVRGMHDAAYMLGFFALLSAVLALVRDRLFASLFGASGLLDVYFAAFRIPDIMYVSLASMISVFALVPFLESRQTEEQQKRIFGNVVFVFSFALIGSALFLYPLVPWLLTVFFPLLVQGPHGAELIAITHILLLQPVLLGISTVLTSIVHMRGRYLLYALAPLLYNVSIIAALVWLYPLFGMYGVVYGVIVGALLHMLVQIPFVLRTGFLSELRTRIVWSEMYQLVVLSLPRTLALSTGSVLLLILTAYATQAGEGAVSIFILAFNLQAAPLAIIGASYSVAAFPTLARHFARGENDAFVTHILTAARHIIFWSLPFLVLFVVLRAHIVRVVLGTGSFDWTDTRLVAAAVALFMVSLVAQGLSLLFIRGYYAAGKTVFPLVVSVGTLIVTTVCASWFTYLFQYEPLFRAFLEVALRVEDLPGAQVLVLPLAFALGALMQALAFVVFFEVHFACARAPLARIFFHASASALIAGFVAYRTLALFAPVVVLERTLGVFAQGFIAGILGVIAGALVLILLKNTEIQEVWHTLHHKFWNALPLFGKTETTP